MLLFHQCTLNPFCSCFSVEVSKLPMGFLLVTKMVLFFKMHQNTHWLILLHNGVVELPVFLANMIYSCTGNILAPDV